MPFTFSDEHIQQFYTQGFTVFRGIVPAALIGDLRRACEQFLLNRGGRRGRGGRHRGFFNSTKLDRIS